MAGKKDDQPMTALNVRIPTDLHRKVKIEAINRGKTVQELVQSAIRSALGLPDDAPVKARPTPPRGAGK